MNTYRMDTHKLMFHPKRVAQFLENGDCYPIYLEISPIGKCNHRCIFCAYDYIGYPNRKLERERTIDFIRELASCGLKSVLYSGEGEPLLHPHISDFVAETKKAGIDVGLYTNGQLLIPDRFEELLSCLSFVRFSFNGGTPQSYSDVHRVSEKAFAQVVSNIEKVTQLKRRGKIDADIGVQYVAIPENIESINGAATLFKKIGVDYFVAKPFNLQDNRQDYHPFGRISTEKIHVECLKLEELSNEKFQAVVRTNAFKNRDEKQAYNHCLGTSFVGVMNSAGDVASCLPYWDNQDFVFGNIYDASFEQIWKGTRRREIKEKLEKMLSIHEVCPPNCRASMINSYLWQICKQNVKHVNFI